MAQPAVGVSFKAAGLAYLDALRVRRGGRWSIAVRDYGGLATDLSPSGDFVAPMAQDGAWRDDLFAVRKNSSGQWYYVNTPNQGFYPIGWVHPDGVERAPKIDSDPLQGLQSVDPIRNDMQKREKTLMFTPFENNPFVHALEFNLPLTGTLERAAAAGTYFAGETTDDDSFRRQVIVMHEDAMGGVTERNAFPFPKCIMTDQGSRKGNRKDADAPKLTLFREIDPYFVDVDGVPIIDGRWVTGELWEQGSVPALSFVPPPPVGTPTAAATANLVIKAPIGGTSPYTYTAQKSASALMTSPSAATVGTPVVANGVVTLPITGLTPGSTSYFRVTVTDAVAAAAASAVSNAVVQPAS